MTPKLLYMSTENWIAGKHLLYVCTLTYTMSNRDLPYLYKYKN